MHSRAFGSSLQLVGTWKSMKFARIAAMRQPLLLLPSRIRRRSSRYLIDDLLRHVLTIEIHVVDEHPVKFFGS